MIILAANGTIAGVASAATQLTCTLFGMELNGATETYKILAPRQLAAAAATIYTATANGPTFIRSINVVNNDTAVRTFSLYVGGTAAANKITPTLSIQPGGLAVYEDALGWQFFNSAGQLLQATGSPNNGVQPNYGITGTLAETMDRQTCPEVNSVLGTTGQIRVQAIWLTAGQTVSNISFHSATTAAGTPTHYVFALYDINRNLLATTADQTSTAWAANTLKTIAVTTPYFAASSSVYILAFLSVPSLKTWFVFEHFSYGREFNSSNVSKKTSDIGAAFIALTIASADD